MAKHWDIKKPYKVRKTKRKQTTPIYPPKYPSFPDVELAPHPDICNPGLISTTEIPCLHKSCPTCHGTGKGPFGACLHMLSCSCRSCSPWMSMGLSESFALGTIHEV